MDKVITTALLIVISMVMALMLFNIAYPAIIEGGDAIVSMAGRVEDRMRSQIAIIHAGSEMDADGWWQDSNGNGQFEVFLWIKNVGDARITALDDLDIFFGPEGNFARIAHETDSGGGTPYWSWTLENAAEWTPTATLRVTIHYGAALSTGRYFAKVTVPSGVWDDYYLGM